MHCARAMATNVLKHYLHKYFKVLLRDFKESMVKIDLIKGIATVSDIGFLRYSRTLLTWQSFTLRTSNTSQSVRPLSKSHASPVRRFALFCRGTRSKRTLCKFPSREWSVVSVNAWCLSGVCRIPMLIRSLARVIFFAELTTSKEKGR